MAVAGVGRNLITDEAESSMQIQLVRLTFTEITPRTFIGQHAHATHMGVAAHHARDEVLESVNEGGSAQTRQSQVKLTFTPRANI